MNWEREPPTAFISCHAAQYTVIATTFLVMGMYLPDVFKALGDETRLRILNLLAAGKELCVCQIEEALMLNQPNASRHLNRLRYAGLICCRRVSQWCFYRLSEDFTEEKHVLFSFLKKEWELGARYASDIQRLHMPLRNNSCKRIVQMFENRAEP